MSSVTSWCFIYFIDDSIFILDPFVRTCYCPNPIAHLSMPPRISQHITPSHWQTFKAQIVWSVQFIFLSTINRSWPTHRAICSHTVLRMTSNPCPTSFTISSNLTLSNWYSFIIVIYLQFIFADMYLLFFYHFRWWGREDRVNLTWWRRVNNGFHWRFRWRGNFHSPNWMVHC